MNAAREFKQLTPDMRLAVRDADPSRSDQLLATVFAADSAIDNITLTEAARALLRSQQRAGDVAGVQGTVDRLLGTLRQRSAGEPILDRVERDLGPDATQYSPGACARPGAGTPPTHPPPTRGGATMKGTSTLDRPATPRPGVLDLDRNLAEMAPAVRAAEDCLSYKPGNLGIITLIRSGRTSYTVRDGSHWTPNHPTFTDAVNAME